MTGSYYKTNISGYVVEISQSKDFIRIVGDVIYESDDSKEVNDYGQCFQIEIKDNTFLDDTAANRLFIRSKVHIEGVELAGEYEGDWSEGSEDYPIAVHMISKYQGLTVEADKVGLDELIKYYSSSYYLPEWSTVENVVWVQGIVVHKSERSLKLMTKISSPVDRNSYQCFQVSLNDEAYERVEQELDQTEVGDTLLVKGSLFYADPSFKHSDFTYDYDKKIRKKVTLDIQGEVLTKQPSMSEAVVLEYLDYYAQDPFRLGVYGDDNLDSDYPQNSGYGY